MTCRTCYWWKRRYLTTGVCWLPAHQTDPVPPTVREDDGCEYHERKVEKAEQAT